MRPRRHPLLYGVIALALGVSAALTATSTAANAQSPTTRHAPSPYPAVKPLPKGFLWGVATAGFQSEGYSPDSNWLRYTKAGKSMDRVGTSVDFRHRYPGDIRRAKRLGIKVYRLSVEWARIEPRPGHYNRHAWHFYDRVMKKIRQAGMRPMITLDHWVYPGWEASRDGWGHAGMTADWIANAKKVVRRYAKYHPLWITFNEPTFYLVNEMRQKGLSPLALATAFDRLVKAHKALYAYIHARQPGAKVSSNVAYVPTAEPVLDTFFLDRVAKQLDYVGIDYYYPVSITNPSAIYSFTGQMWKSSLSADGIYYALRHYAQQFPKLPLYIVENGMPTDNANPRADHYTRAANLRDTVYWLQRARDDGMDVIGYNYWSLTDNYEWCSYEPRFGLYTVNVKTDPSLRRHPTGAVGAYRAITAHRGVPRHYQPTREPEFCSLVDGLGSCLSPVH